MAEITIKQGEAKTLTFTVKEKGEVIDLSSATDLKFYVANRDRTGYIIQKNVGDFDRSQDAAGILRVDISDTESDQTPMTYKSELMITFSASDIDKSADIDFTVEEAVI
jgi:hypothetical protein